MSVKIDQRVLREWSVLFCANYCIGPDQLLADIATHWCKQDSFYGWVPQALRDIADAIECSKKKDGNV